MIGAVASGRLSWLLIGICLSGFSATGCNFLPGHSTAATDDEDDFEELERNLLEESIPKAPAADQESLELKLKVGDRFPLVKTVEQRLTQATAEGVWHTRKIETMLSVTVEEIKGREKRLGVRYHRVKYFSDVAGQKVAYDSQSTASTPTEALQFAGLVNNGFSFWLGANNEIAELIGFEQFLEKCGRALPPSERPNTKDGWATIRSEDGLANFIDDSLGLLPTGIDADGKPLALQVGYHWEPKPTRIEGELPMQVRTRCMLKELSESVAEIDMTGSIPAVSVTNEKTGVKLSLLNGICHGSCTVDRSSGLPTRSRVQRYLDMAVQLADGTTIPQRKEIVTTIDTFPDQPNSERTIELTSGFDDPTERRPRPVYRAK